MNRLMQSAAISVRFPIAPDCGRGDSLTSAFEFQGKLVGQLFKSKSKCSPRLGRLYFTHKSSILLGLVTSFVAMLGAASLTAQVTITPNVPKYPFQVLADSTRQINVNIAGGTQNTVNWSVLSTTGGASATFTTPKGGDVSSVANTLATIQVNIGPTQGNCTISGSGSAYQINSTATVTVRAQSVDDPAKTASFLFNVCANSPATLANGTNSVIIAPAYQQAYQNQPMTLQSWVVGCSDESGTWSIIAQPSGGNGTLTDTNYRDAIFAASATGRYEVQYKANCNSGTTTAIVYVSPNPMPAYTSTPNGTRPHECYVDPELGGADYEVGAGKAYATISSTPALTGFKPGTIVRIWNTDTTGTNPSVYHEYYNVQNSGTPTQPIIICGIADSRGNLPIMDGTDAKAQSDVETAAGSGIITLWSGPSHYGYWQSGSGGPNYISITGLHLRNANSTIKHYLPGTSSESNWDNFTGCVNARSGTFVDISGNHLDNCSLGLFTAENGNDAWSSITQNFTLIGNHVDQAGDPNDPVSTHELYLQTYYMLVEGNRLDDPTQYVGSLAKWRGIEGIFRYNYLGDGAERLIDLVDNSDGPQYMAFERYLDLYGYGDTAGANVVAAYQESFQKDFIYGNMMFGTSAAAQIHYADDQGGAQMSNRNGVLYFYSNTLDNAQLIFDTGEWDSAANTYYQPRVDARNNILWGRSLSWTGLIHMQFGTTSSLILDATTNLMRVGTFSIQTPIMGDIRQNGTASGWSNVCDPSPCLWPLQVPLETHLYGLTSANYLSSAVQPYDSSTMVPANGSAAIGAGTANTISPLNIMPVRWQYSVATGALTLRRDPLTIGAVDPATGGVQIAATPSFSPVAGTYSSTQTVSINSTTPGSTIYYTTDGSTPTTGSQSYSGPITVSSSETISAIAVASGYSNSPVGSASYVITQGQVATPQFSPAAGTYTSAQQVAISTVTAGATIYYTTNGTTPTTGSSVYSGPITVSTSQTIEAIAVASGFSNSAIATAAYTINVVTVSEAAAPTFSPTAGTYTLAQNVTISSITPAATIYYTTNGNTPTTSSTIYSGPISVSTSQTIQAIAVASGFSNSAVASAAYTINLTSAADFSISASPTSLAVAPGTPGATTVSIVPQSGFNSMVVLSCSGLPAGTSCNFAQAAVKPAGGATSTVLTITRTSTATNEHERSPFVPGSVLAAAFCFIGWKKRCRLQMLVLLAVCTASAFFMSGCGGTFILNSANASVLSTITVTGTSGTIQHSSTVSVSVK